MFSRGQLASLAGVNSETIRYYERKGLLPKPQRTPAGYRQYAPNDLKRLQFILAAKRHGFTLAEIKELLELRVSDSATCRQVRAKAQNKITQIESQINLLIRMKTALQILAATCHQNTPADNCPILEAFDQAI